MRALTLILSPLKSFFFQFDFPPFITTLLSSNALIVVYVVNGVRIDVSATKTSHMMDVIQNERSLTYKLKKFLVRESNPYGPGDD